jgi:hypothetical protein
MCVYEQNKQQAFSSQLSMLFVLFYLFCDSNVAVIFSDKALFICDKKLCRWIKIKAFWIDEEKIESSNRFVKNELIT